MSTLPLFPAAAQEPEGRVSLAAKLADYFKAWPNQWIDGKELAQWAGAYGWRTRVSELRKPPYNMTIENRVRPAVWSSKVKVSEYRYLPVSEGQESRQSA